MSKPIKELITNQLRGEYQGVQEACVVELSGMKVEEQEALRGSLREKSARVEVVKNSLARRAFDDTVLEPLGKSLTGPCALVTSTESLVEVAKTLVAAAKEFANLKLKQAMFAGDPALLTVEELSKMRTLNDILGDLTGLVSSPGRSIAGCMQSPQGKIAGCLKAIVEKG